MLFLCEDILLRHVDFQGVCYKYCFDYRFVSGVYYSKVFFLSYVIRFDKNGRHSRSEFKLELIKLKMNFLDETIQEGNHIYKMHIALLNLHYVFNDQVTSLLREFSIRI